MKFLHNERVASEYPKQYTVVLLLDQRPDDVILLNAIPALLERTKSMTLEIESACRHWEEMFLRMGAGPEHKSSLVAAKERFQKVGKLWKIMPLVDFYNHMSLAFQCPMAAYDADALVGNLELAKLGKGRSFVPLGPKEAEQTEDNEVGYIDSEKVVCRYWNLKDCDQSKIVTGTRRIVFVCDVTSADYSSAVAQSEETRGSIAQLTGIQPRSGGVTGNGGLLEVQL